MKVDPNNPADKWFVKAHDNARRYGTPLAELLLPDKTYEAVGPHFQGNPHGFVYDTLIRHGYYHAEIEDRSFEGIRKYLRDCNIEGIVFWKDGEPQCKIKRTDFGFEWPIKTKED